MHFLVCATSKIRTSTESSIVCLPIKPSFEHINKDISKSEMLNNDNFVLRKFSSEAILSLLKIRDDPKFPADVNQLKNTSGIRQFYHVLEIHATANTKIYCNLNPRHSVIHSNAFYLQVTNVISLQAMKIVIITHANLNVEFVKKILIKKGKTRGELLFKIGLLTNKDTCMKFPHVDDSELYCHVSGDYEGFWIILFRVIYDKPHYENFHVPFGHVLILSDKIYHGCCLGSYGSFMFHFNIKNKCSRAEERLIKNIAYLKTPFY